MTLWKINVSFMTAIFARAVNARGMSISRSIKHDLCEALQNNVSSNLGISEDQRPHGDASACKFRDL